MHIAAKITQHDVLLCAAQRDNRSPGVNAALHIFLRLQLLLQLLMAKVR